ncbi:hypothetical protein Cfor_04664 [Coptotermes formosanus]|uniref:Lysosome-associated membrane glycoprotein 5 n=1 Tax=Coptotermes formosanus TaxID=36987 RepID=A0A6L2PHK7_COPFO|nr:hypothetical protein Cfor_04664 [Coptotermes formosanus]
MASVLAAGSGCLNVLEGQIVERSLSALAIYWVHKCGTSCPEIVFIILFWTLSFQRKYALLDIPKNATATGHFGNDTQILNITWCNKDNTSNNFIILFKKNSTDNRYMIKNISVNVILTKEEFPDIRGQNVTITLYNNKTEFSTPLSKSYRCAKEQTFDLFGSNNTTGAIKLSHIQLEAFHEKMDDLFDAAEDCERASSPDIVPIAVGCALVGLVAIVLIAYLVGRRRSQARGYLSMGGKKPCTALTFIYFNPLCTGCNDPE